MLDIYICEDDMAQLNLITQHIENTRIIEELDMQLALATSDPYELLEKVRVSKNTGIFFLDISLGAEISGLELAHKIRKIQPRCFIIFITSHSDLGLATFQYKVEALDFICKNDFQQVHSRIHDCLLDIAQKQRCDSKQFTITKGCRQISVNFDDILFFSTSENAHKVTLYAYTRIIEFAGNLKIVEQQLDERFLRCHRSYLINKDKIAEVDFNALTVQMEGGRMCPISLRMKSRLKRLCRRSAGL